MTAAFETAVTDAGFRDLQVLIRQEAGIHLEPARRSLLIAGLSRRMRALGVRSFGQYYDRMGRDDGDEKRQMIDAICTNETHFFRDVRQFDFFRTVVLPDIERKSDRIRIWSAGCSTGVKRLLGALRPGGYLFLGHAESLAGMSSISRTSVLPSVQYRPMESARQRRR